jgi:hypothetical protein
MIMPFRNALTFNLESAQACTGGHGEVYGTLYRADRQRRKVEYSPAPLEFGGYKPDFADPVRLLRRALELEEQQHDITVPPEAALALVALRQCHRVQHQDKPKERDHSGSRLERLAVIGVVHGNDGREPFRPLSGAQLEAAEQAHGLTTARRRSLSGSLDAPVILMPRTEAEDTRYLTTPLEGIAIGPHFRAMNRQPYLLLHASGGKTIENIVLLQQIQ